MIQARPTITVQYDRGQCGCGHVGRPQQLPGKPFLQQQSRLRPTRPITIASDRTSTATRSPRCCWDRPIDIVNASNTIPVAITTAANARPGHGDSACVSAACKAISAPTATTRSPSPDSTTFTLTGSVGTAAYIGSGLDFMQRLTVLDNSLNGLFVRIRVQSGQTRSTADGGGPLRRHGHYAYPDPGLDRLGHAGRAAAALAARCRARTDASLAIDPGIVVKLSGGRVETQISTQVAGGRDRRQSGRLHGAQRRSLRPRRLVRHQRGPCRHDALRGRLGAACSSTGCLAAASITP